MLPILTSLVGSNWEDVVLKVSLVRDIPSWEVSGHHKSGTVRSGGLADTQLFSALPHHCCEMAWMVGEMRKKLKAENRVRKKNPAC